MFSISRFNQAGREAPRSAHLHEKPQGWRINRIRYVNLCKIHIIKKYGEKC